MILPALLLTLDKYSSWRVGRVVPMIHSAAGPCRDLWRGRCSKYKRGTCKTAFNRAVLLADMCIEMDASVLIQQQMP